jgi:hypothetical protein
MQLQVEPRTSAVVQLGTPIPSNTTAAGFATSPNVGLQGTRVQVELEQRLLRRKDMETELLMLTGAMADVLQQGHTEADSLASSVHSTSAKAQQVLSIRIMWNAFAQMTANMPTSVLQPLFG